MRNLVLVGLGPHAKKIYYPLLEKYSLEFDIRIKLIIDLESQRELVEKFLDGQRLKPEKVLLLKSSPQNVLGKEIDPEAEKALNILAKSGEVDGILIVTEPKAHKLYIEWAAKHGVDILADKPLTSPVGACVDVEAARQVYADYLDVMKIVKKSGINFYVMVQRRNHEGYIHVWDYLDEFVSRYGIPISYFESYFADGTWTLPNEFNKENHPYKYGYGKLMHSGYHSMDLFSWITSINDKIKEKKPNKIRLYVNRFGAPDFLSQINQKDYHKLFGKTEKIDDFFKKYNQNDFKKYGELDVFVMIQMMRDDIIVNTSSITLQQNSFSRRSWLDYPEDPYKGNGRLRHERQNIQVSNLLNIQIHTYQSYESRHKLAESPNVSGVGHEHHMDVFFFRNSDLIGGKPLEKIDYGEIMREKNLTDKYYMGHNEKGKDFIIQKFLAREKDTTELIHHARANKLLSKICEALAQQQSGLIPYIEYSLEGGENEKPTN